MKVERIDLFALTRFIGWENISISMEIDNIKSNFTIPENFDWVNSETILLTEPNFLHPELSENLTFNVENLIDLINKHQANLVIEADNFTLLHILNIKDL